MRIFDWYIKHTQNGYFSAWAVLFPDIKSSYVEMKTETVNSYLGILYKIQCV